MSSLYGILTMKTLMHAVPTYVLIAFAVIVGIAFLVGFAKGVRRVAWGAFYWLLASVSYVLVYYFFRNYNILLWMVAPEMASVAEFIWAMLLALVCMMAWLLVYGILGLLLRPREVLYTDKEVEIDELGFVFEEDWEDDGPDFVEETYVIKNGKKPKLFGRLAGGFMTALNAAAVLSVIVSLVLFVVNGTVLKNGYIGYIFDVPLVQTVFSYASAYALDFITIGIVMAVTIRGYRRGFVGTTRKFVVFVGVIAILAACFVIPFTQFSYIYFISRLIERCASMYTSLDVYYQFLLGRITAGVVLAIPGIVLVVVINVLLKKLVNAVNSCAFLRVVDGMFAAVLYAILGALLVTVFWCLLYILEYCGIFYVSDGFDGAYATLSTRFLDFAEFFLKNFVDGLLLQFKA